MHFALAFFAIIVLIVIHEAGHFWIARLCRMKVERFSIFFGPALARIKTKATTYQIGCVPLGGFVQITGMNPMEEHDANDPYIYPNRPAWQRFATILAGPWMNYMAAVAIMFGVIYAFGMPRVVRDPKMARRQEISQVRPSRPAAAAGLRPGDILVSIAGHPVDVDHPAPGLLDAEAGKAVPVVVLREGREQSFTVTALKEGDGHFRMGVVLGPVVEMERVGVLRAVGESFVYPAFATVQMAVQTFKHSDQLSSVVDVTKQLGDQIRWNPRDAITTIAHLSIFLGLFNLLPIPALDGGRLAFLLYEIIARRRVNQRFEAGVHMVGMVVLLGVMMIFVFRDVRHLFTRGG
jgi:regulator of sigma E protease